MVQSYSTKFFISNNRHFINIKMEKSKLEDIEIEDEETESLDDKEELEDKDDSDDYDDDLDFDDFGSESQPPLEKYSDLLKELTNFNPYLKELVNGWLGLVWDQDSKSYKTSKELIPIMNTKCAGWCVSYLKTYARKTNIITHIGKNEYGFLVNDIIDVLWLNIGLRSETFGIKNNGDILRVCTELQHASELILMGAGDGKYNEMLKTTTNRNENVNTSQKGDNDFNNNACFLCYG